MNAALIAWLVNLISGAIGGNLAGAAMKDKSLGTLGNTIAGILGGGLGGVATKALGLIQAGGLDIGSVIGSIATGGVGGAIIMVLGAIIKRMMAGKA